MPPSRTYQTGDRPDAVGLTWEPVVGLGGVTMDDRRDPRYPTWRASDLIDSLDTQVQRVPSPSPDVPPASRPSGGGPASGPGGGPGSVPASDAETTRRMETWQPPAGNQARDQWAAGNTPNAPTWQSPNGPTPGGPTPGGPTPGGPPPWTPNGRAAPPRIANASAGASTADWVSSAPTAAPAPTYAPPHPGASAPAWASPAASVARVAPPVRTPSASASHAPAPAPRPAPQPPRGQRSRNPLRAANAWLLGIFVTDPSSGSSLGYLDGLRAIACLLVVAVHVHLQSVGHQIILPLPGSGFGFDFTPIVARGAIGVYLFFVLSGFLLSQSWIKADYHGKPRPKLLKYFKLRILRIVPAYYVCLLFLLIFFVPRVIPAPQVLSQEGLLNVVEHLSFMQFLFPIASASWGLALPFWSLTMEALFYLMLPVVVWAFCRRRWLIGLPLAAIISIGWVKVMESYLIPVFTPHVVAYAHRWPEIGAWYGVTQAQFYIANQFPAHALSFALGMTAANLYLRGRLPLSAGAAVRALTGRWAGATYFILGCALVLIEIYGITPTMPFLHLFGAAAPAPTTDPLAAKVLNYMTFYEEPITSLGFALMVLGASLAGRIIQGILGFTPLRIIGIISYSIYLFHLPLLHNVTWFPGVLTLAPDQRFSRILLQILVEVIPLSILVYLAVEKPFMQLARRGLRSAVAPEAPAEPARAIPGSWRASPVAAPQGVARPPVRNRRSS